MSCLTRCAFLSLCSLKVSLHGVGLIYYTFQRFVVGLVVSVNRLLVYNVSFDFSSPYKLLTATPSHYVLFGLEKGWWWRKRSGGKVHSMRGRPIIGAEFCRL